MEGIEVYLPVEKKPSEMRIARECHNDPSSLVVELIQRTERFQCC